MNITESKSNILMEAVYKILTTDTADTGLKSREISHYCSNRVFRSKLLVSPIFPLITMETDEIGGELLLPSQRFLLTVQAHVKKEMEYALTSLDNLSNRIEYLLNKNTTSINLAVSSKKLRCRLINKVSALLTTDELKEVHTKSIQFDVVIGDELLQCN